MPFLPVSFVCDYLRRGIDLIETLDYWFKNTHTYLSIKSKYLHLPKYNFFWLPRSLQRARYHHHNKKRVKRVVTLWANISPLLQKFYNFFRNMTRPGNPGEGCEEGEGCPDNPVAKVKPNGSRCRSCGPHGVYGERIAHVEYIFSMYIEYINMAGATLYIQYESPPR